jgi:hypothetical protein
MLQPSRIVPDVRVPARVERVFLAGPPAAVLLYTLAPDLLLGWPRANRPQECAYMLPDICTRPEVGRITGRGNTANLETVLALKPDLIVDVGSTNETFVSLAARVQDQTGIPYALLDGRFVALTTAYLRDDRTDRSQCRWRRAWWSRQRFDRAGAAVESRCDCHHRPGIFRRRAQ